MALERAQSGQVIALDAPAATTHALYKDDQIEVARLVLGAGKTFPAHAVPGPITLQGLSGEVELEHPGGSTLLAPGRLVCLQGGAPHALRALSDASVLLTIVLPAGFA